MLSCNEVQKEWLLALRFDALEEDERAQAKAHLDACEGCRESLRSIDGALGDLSAPKAKAPSGAWSKLRDRIEADAAASASQARITIAVSCTYCKDSLERKEALFCGSCLAPHHGECWETHGRCAAMGCEETRTVRPIDGSPEKLPEAATEAKPRKKQGMIIPFFFGALTAVGVAAYSQYSITQKQAVPPQPPVPSARKSEEPAPAYRVIQTPFLPSLRSVKRSTLPPEVVGVRFDGEGYPWFSIDGGGAPIALKPREGQADKAVVLDYEASLERSLKQRGAPDSLLLVVNGRLASHGKDGTFYFFDLNGSRPTGLKKAVGVPGDETFDKTVLEGLDSIPDHGREFVEFENVPNLDVGVDEVVLGTDRWGRIFLRSGNRIEVFDPWAELSAPSDLYTSGWQAPFAAPHGASSSLSDVFLASQAKPFESKEPSVIVLAEGVILANGVLISDEHPDLAGTSISGKEFLRRVQSRRSLLVSKYRPERPQFGPYRIVVDGQESVWVLDRKSGLLTVIQADNSSSSTTLKHKGSTLRGIYPHPSGAGVLGHMRDEDGEQPNRMALVGLKTEPFLETVIRVPEFKNRDIVTTADGLTWHPLDKHSRELCTWQGGRVDDLPLSANPKLWADGSLYLTSDKGLLRWDGSWLLVESEQQVFDSRHFVHDKARELVLILEFDGRNLIVAEHSRLRLAGERKTVRYLVDLKTYREADLVDETPYFVAGGKLWIRWIDGTCTRVWLPPQ